MKIYFSTILILFSLVAKSQNLIVNPSGEADPFASGWTNFVTGSSCYTGSNWRVPHNQNGFPVAQDGSYFFYSGCGGASGETYQDIDVSADAVAIDANAQQYMFSGFMHSYNQASPDGAQIIVEYRDNVGTVLGSYDTGETNNTGGWVGYSDTRLAPALTRTIRIRLISIANNGDSVDGYFDDLSLTTISLLPITLLDFQARLTTNNQVKIEWTTSSEINNDYFTIEKSRDGIIWNTLKTIKGAGNSTQLLRYEYYDTRPAPSMNYFRLVQTDYDGTKTKSFIVQVNGQASFGDNVFPNPCTDKITLAIDNLDISDIQLMNASGRQINMLNRISESKSGLETILYVNDLSAGIYFIKIDNDFIKVIKQ